MFYQICLAFIILSTEVLADEEKYCVTCKALIKDAINYYGQNISTVTESSLTTTTSSLCRKYYIGFEEVICRILLQVNASDLLKALQTGVSIDTICEKGGVCNNNDYYRQRII
ncbi:unnamed protein product [Auanema sp. JU1783]|nr:unnamed protein product [Auanema sp. JU1783]